MQCSEFSMESFDTKKRTSIESYNSTLKYTLASGQNMLGSSRVCKRIWVGHSGWACQNLQPQHLIEIQKHFRLQHWTSAYSTGQRPGSCPGHRNSSGKLAVRILKWLSAYSCSHLCCRSRYPHRPCSAALSVPPPSVRPETKTCRLCCII
jgi:hypothetical protein